MEPVETIDIDSKNLEAVLKGMLGYTQPGGQVYSYFKDCVVTAGAKPVQPSWAEKKKITVCLSPLLLMTIRRLPLPW